MERVFVVRRSDFFAGDWPQGFAPVGTPAPGGLQPIAALCAQMSTQGFFVDRTPAEEDPSLKQVIERQ